MYPALRQRRRGDNPKRRRPTRRFIRCLVAFSSLSILAALFFSVSPAQALQQGPGGSGGKDGQPTGVRANAARGDAGVPENERCVDVETPAYRPGEVLVEFEQGTTRKEQAEARKDAGAASARRVTAPRSRENVQVLSLEPSVSEADALAALMLNPDVESAGLNLLRRADYTPSSPEFRYQWGLNNTNEYFRGSDIHACEAWDIEKGDSNPVTVAIIDTGIDLTHPNLAGRLWTNAGEIPGNEVDDDGNGYVDDYHGYNWAGISNYFITGGTYLGHNQDSQEVAQSFTARVDPGDTSFELTSLELMLTKRGSPSAQIIVSVRSSIDGPDLVSYTVAPGEVPTKGWAYVNETFSQPVSCTPDGTYYIFVRTTGTDEENYYVMPTDHTFNSVYDAYTEGSIWWKEDGAWAAQGIYDYYFKTNGYYYNRDNNGHGTHCAGIAGAGDTGSGSVGVAFGDKTRLMALKAGDAGGSLWTSDWVAALDYARTMQVDVASMSFGGGYASPVEQSAITRAWSAGVTLFAAAGNDGYNTYRYPSSYEHVISVAATDNQDRRADFSTYNTAVDLAAPGVSYYSTMPTYPVPLNKLGYDQDYAWLNGTSMATPCAAGVGALLLSHDPSLGPDQVEERLESTADDVGGNERDDCFGHGRVNASRALGGPERGPILCSIDPVKSPVGTTVTLKGNEFGNVEGTSSVRFGDTEMATTSWKCNEIKCSVPDDLLPRTYNVTVVTPAGTSDPRVFTVPATVTSVDPAYVFMDVNREQTLDVEIVGAKTHFRNGASRATFDNVEGITVNSTTVIDATHARANITVSATADGMATVNVRTAGEVPEPLEYGFEVRRPRIASVSPDRAYRCDTQDVEIVGTNTHFRDGVSRAVFTGPYPDEAITVNSTGVLDETHAVVNITVPEDVDVTYFWASPWSVNVETGAEVPASDAFLSIVDPYIQSVQPESAYPGQTLDVEIVGAGTRFAGGASQLSLNPADGITVNSVTVLDATHAAANITIAPDAGTWSPWRLTVVTPGTIEPESVYFSLTYQYVASVSPATARRGQTLDVSIVGVNTRFEDGASRAIFDSADGITVNSTTVIDSTHARANITVASDAASTTRAVSVKTGDSTCGALWFVFSIERCYINKDYGLEPKRGYRGQTLDVQIVGVGTEFKAGVSRATFSGEDITVNSTTVLDQTRAVANINISPTASLWPRDVNVVTGDEKPQPATNAFSVDKPYIAPASISGTRYGFWGEIMDVYIEGVGTNFKQEESRVTFEPAEGITVNSIKVYNATQAVANITISRDARVGMHDINVITGEELPEPCRGGFSVGSGYIRSVSPAYGYRGQTTSVDIVGFNTYFNAVSKAVFSGDGITVNAVNVTDFTHARVNITISPDASPGARDVNLVAARNEPLPLPSGFSVTDEPPPVQPPSIASISPSRGNQGELVNVTLAGANFQPGSGTTYVSLIKAGQPNLTAGNVNVISATQVTGTFDLTGAAAGAWDVSVRNPDGQTGTLPGGFTVDPAAQPQPDPATDPQPAPAPQPEPGSQPQPEPQPEPQPKPDPGASSTWYLAEGSTSHGFDTYISIENPNDVEVHAEITYNTTDGPVPGGTIALPPTSQATVNPAGAIGSRDFSTVVRCVEGRNIAVDRTMTWTGEGASSPEAHSSVGVTSPQKTWYLPEGSCGWGFETWLLVQNPNSSDATCRVTYMTEGKSPKTVEHEVPANSRESYSMADDLGFPADASIRVESDIPVIPERAMYKNGRREGHDSIGTTTTANDYYLAEGSTAHGFTTYVLVMNPNGAPVDVTITYMTDAGPVETPAFQIPPNSRKTVRVNDVLPEKDLSPKVHGSLPIIAERAMYWRTETGEACHDSIGMSSPHAAFYLPDGETSRGRETYTLVMNPNGEPVEVEISYLNPGGKGATFTDTVGADSRKTYNMAEKVSGRAAVVVRVKTPGRKILVERSMYWNYRGAGTDTIGGYAD